jgi:glycosyltransferase involved in cell wall biosynthesis
VTTKVASADRLAVGEPADAELISVVLNFFNAAPFLREALDSVYAQTHPRWELLLVDDGSVDDSTQIARQAAAHDPRRVRYLEHPGHENRGASAARNLGIANTSGDFIAFLDADDVWKPNRLARSAALLRAHPDADLVYGASEYWHSWTAGRAPAADRIQPQGFPADRVVAAPELLIRHLTHRAALPVPTSITIRSGAARARGWVESFRGMHDDHAFLARLCLHHGVFVSSECWDRYRQHEDSICATAERRGEVRTARRTYLAWLRGFLQQERVADARVWAALCYAERVQQYDRAGWRARVARTALRISVQLKIALAARAASSR